MGEGTEAREVFGRAAACANEVGLPVEETGLVNAAWAIGRAEAGAYG
ncbi:hypothetical protein [Streptomyces sp. NPDC056628]